MDNDISSEGLIQSSSGKFFFDFPTSSYPHYVYSAVEVDSITAALWSDENTSRHIKRVEIDKNRHETWKSFHDSFQHYSLDPWE